MSVMILILVYTWQEELGIEYNEDVGVSLQPYSDMLQHGKKRPRVH